MTRAKVLTVLSALIGSALLSSSGLRADGSKVRATTVETYRTTLVGGYMPSSIRWAGRNWRVNAGSTVTRNMDHALRIGSRGQKMRFEIRNTENDNSPSDSSEVRRAELSGSLVGDPARLPNGTVLWGAMSFNHHSWADPEGMSTLMGGVYGQIHMGSKFGGSPAVAFRRTKKGLFRVTTRGEYDTAGSVRHEALLGFDRVHHLVYRVLLDPHRGSLAVWLDGAKIVDVADVSIGSRNAQSYFNCGLYFSGGVTAPVVAEYGNVVYPGTVSLAKLVTSPPAWPAG
jgi:Polysaccharide lyase